MFFRSLILSLLPLILCACRPDARASRADAPGYVYQRSDPGDSAGLIASDVNAFCPLDGDGRPVCPAGPEMAWRLRNYLRSLDSYLAAVNVRGGPHRAARTEGILAARGRIERELESAANRARVQAGLVEELNRDFGCRLTLYDKGQQINFARELSLPECDPLVPSESARAAELLKNLAEVSLPVDAEVLGAKSKMYSAVGQIVREIAQYKQKLLDLNVLRTENGRILVDLIGHPYGREDHTKWLEAYMQRVRKLGRELERLSEPAGQMCPEPACDPAIYQLAEAVTLKPPLDWTFLREGESVMPPTAYGLSYFSGRYDANGDIRHALQLGSNREWHWDSEDYVNMLNPDDNTLTFTRIFSAENITLSIAHWDQRTEFPNVVPIFYLFQEARLVVDVLKGLPASARARGIRDIQFAAAHDGQDFVSVSRVPEGLRLNLNVLRPPGGAPIAEVREKILSQIPAALERTDVGSL